MGAIFNVLLVVFLVYLMFAIVGMSLLADKLHYCDVSIISKYNISSTRCRELGYEWVNKQANFDNVGYGLITLVAMGSLEGWPDIMYSAIDGR